jgi:hypothetical protein
MIHTSAFLYPGSLSQGWQVARFAVAVFFG